MTGTPSTHVTQRTPSDFKEEQSRGHHNYIRNSVFGLSEFLVVEAKLIDEIGRHLLDLVVGEGLK